MGTLAPACLHHGRQLGCFLLSFCSFRRTKLSWSLTYPERRSPTWGHQRTTRRSEWCKSCQKWLQVPSTWAVAGPAWVSGKKKNTFTPLSQLFCRFCDNLGSLFFFHSRFIFDIFWIIFLCRRHLRLLCAHNPGLCKCLWPAQSHRSSPRCSRTAGCCVRPSRGGCTVRREGRRRRSLAYTLTWIFCTTTQQSPRHWNVPPEPDTWSSHQRCYNRRRWVPFPGWGIVHNQALNNNGLIL